MPQDELFKSSSSWACSVQVSTPIRGRSHGPLRTSAFLTTEGPNGSLWGHVAALYLLCASAQAQREQGSSKKDLPQAVRNCRCMESAPCPFNCKRFDSISTKSSSQTTPKSSNEDIDKVMAALSRIVSVRP